MALSKEEFIKEIESMSVVDLHSLVEAIKEKFGVTGAMAVASSGGAVADAVEEKNSFDVVLKDAGANKIAVIKVIKVLLGLGLKESKEVAEASGKTIKEGVSKDEAEEMKVKLTAAGATVELK